MKHEFHIGDYVETKEGKVGYITRLEYTLGGLPMYFGWEDGDGMKYCQSVYTDEAIDLFGKYFRRIGKYEFSKQEKKKIKLLTKPQWGIQVEDLIGKINEIIDVVNNSIN